MPGRGVHFALSETELRPLLDAGDDEEVMEQIDELEGRWDKAWLAETDSAWPAIHLALTSKSAPPRLGRAVLGGQHLYGGDDYHVVLVPAKEVPDVASALSVIDETAFRRLYNSINPRAYGRPQSAEDLTYTWRLFAPLQQFWRRAAEAKRAVVFTADK